MKRTEYKYSAGRPLAQYEREDRDTNESFFPLVVYPGRIRVFNKNNILGEFIKWENSSEREYITLERLKKMNVRILSLVNFDPMCYTSIIYEPEKPHVKKPKTAEELIRMIDDTFDEKYGPCGETCMTMPDGRWTSAGDVGFALEWWEEFKKSLENLEN